MMDQTSTTKTAQSGHSTVDQIAAVAARFPDIRCARTVLRSSEVAEPIGRDILRTDLTSAAVSSVCWLRCLAAQRRQGSHRAFRGGPWPPSDG